MLKADTDITADGFALSAHRRRSHLEEIRLPLDPQAAGEFTAREPPPSSRLGAGRRGRDSTVPQPRVERDHDLVIPPAVSEVGWGELSSVGPHVTSVDLMQGIEERTSVVEAVVDQVSTRLSALFSYRESHAEMASSSRAATGAEDQSLTPLQEDSMPFEEDSAAVALQLNERGSLSGGEDITFMTIIGGADGSRGQERAQALDA